MKIPVGLFLLLCCAGCQTATPVSPLPAPPKPALELRPLSPMAPAPTPVASPVEQKVKQQAQLIEALISQNDALTAKVASTAAVTPTSNTPPTVAPKAASTNAPPPARSPEPGSDDAFIMPNADGMIDLVAVTMGETTGEAVNPFAVRMLPPEKTREVTLRVGGTVSGENPCAVLNERLVQPGDVVESLAVQRIDADAVILSRGEQRLRLPVAEKPVRVRLPL